LRLRLPTTARGALEIRAADVNGDGAADLVITQPDRDSVGVLVNQGDGTFASLFELPIGGIHPTSLRAADLDRDGTLDIVSVNEGSSDLSILLQGVPVPHVDRFNPGATTRVSAVNGRLNQPITAAFNTALDPRSVTDTTIRVYANQSGFHNATLTYVPAERLVTIDTDPRNPYRPGESVTVIFTRDIRSDRGIPLGPWRRPHVHGAARERQRGIRRARAGPVRQDSRTAEGSRLQQ
jgi:hypothetical protein